MFLSVKIKGLIVKKKYILQTFERGLRTQQD